MTLRASDKLVIYSALALARGITLVSLGAPSQPLAAWLGTRVARVIEQSSPGRRTVGQRENTRPSPACLTLERLQGFEWRP